MEENTCLVCFKNDLKLSFRQLCNYCKYKYCNYCSTKLLNKCSICYRNNFRNNYINQNNNNNNNNNNENNNENNIRYLYFPNTTFLMICYNLIGLYIFSSFIFFLYYYNFC
jgi:hypothetical protein